MCNNIHCCDSDIIADTQTHTHAQWLVSLVSLWKLGVVWLSVREVPGVFCH